LHTTFSDGTDRPERVVELAKESGLSAMAITDHDNTEALAVARPVAGRLGIELIAGIEMSAVSQGNEVHVLGLLIDPQNPRLIEHLAIQQARRVRRVREMVKRLEQAGVRIDADEVLALAGEGTVGRPHVARVLMKRGYVSSVAEAFSKYIGNDGPGFVPGSTVSPAEVTRIILDAGGVPVLAHPVYLKRDDLIDDFVKDGLAGLEVYHSSHTPEKIRHYEAIADRLGLLKTGGSDYHGDAKEGLPIGSVKIPYALLQSLKTWKTAHVH
jgi:predicted metal-dependent phosphoesterase TrpH